ncbi:hypothetical protein F5888DRAFT_1658984 [Russula emetica]|nr:hypothetical protein F5888DRAFT_1658984 [Russula emetica]
MLSKSSAASIFLLALTSSVNAQCVVTPPLGGSGKPTAGDVQQPFSVTPCGSIPIAQNIDSSEAVKADTSGKFIVSIINFGTGPDGSRHIKTVSVDQTGTGDNFAEAQMVANGDEDPTSDGTQQLTVQLPNGTKCDGGSGKDRCLVSFATDAGYGNCVVVTQPGNNVKRSTSGGEEKPKPHKGHKEKGGKKTKETRGDEEKPKPHKGHKEKGGKKTKEARSDEEKPKPHKGHKSEDDKEKGGKKTKEARGDEEKPKPHKGHKSEEDKGKGGKKTKETRGDKGKSKSHKSHKGGKKTKETRGDN